MHTFINRDECCGSSARKTAMPLDVHRMGGDRRQMTTRTAIKDRQSSCLIGCGRYLDRRSDCTQPRWIKTQDKADIWRKSRGSSGNTLPAKEGHVAECATSCTSLPMRTIPSRAVSQETKQFVNRYNLILSCTKLPLCCANGRRRVKHQRGRFVMSMYK